MQDLINILRIDASLKTEGSVSVALGDLIVDKFANDGAVHVQSRKAADLPAIDETWIGANFTPADERSDIQNAALALSDALIKELQQADTVLITTPIYNFGIPSHLKAWIDHIARARVTFRYTESGPIGLLVGKRAVIAIASGGTVVDSDIDFATPYLRHALGFVGITDITVIAADAHGKNLEAKMQAAKDMIQTL